MKADQYHQNTERQMRQAKQVKQVDHDVFLASLEQKAVLRDFEPLHLDRITQLINKTNQFNLTTRRMTRSQVEEMVVHTKTKRIFHDAGFYR